MMDLETEFREIGFGGQLSSIRRVFFELARSVDYR